MANTEAPTFFPDVRTLAVFSAEGPQPQFIVNLPNFKALVVGLDAGQRIPAHPGETAIYHFLDGSGHMQVGDTTYPVQPGVTLVAADGVRRGIQAQTRVVFLAAKPG